MFELQVDQINTHYKNLKQIMILHQLHDDRAKYCQRLFFFYIIPQINMRQKKLCVANGILKMRKHDQRINPITPHILLILSYPAKPYNRPLSN